MDAERWQKIKEILEDYLELPPSEQAVYLAKINQEDQELGDQIARLAASEQAFSDFLENPVSAVATQTDESQIGPYKILVELGQGGMGRVYLAERADQTLKRKVALKVIKRGMDTDEIVKRFKNERMILADLEHPNIARLYNAGATRDGLPFFAMEYIEGQPIHTYCRENKLDIPEILALVGKVCQAVQYAHQHLIVHRDIKPGNILVTKDGEPKLLDFGIAKLLQLEKDGQTTRTAARMMTPDYASPEQLSGNSITTVSDVYAIGVLLFELLTGKRPKRHEGQISERPSQIAEGASQRRLKGDVDNIVSRALQFKAADRYSSIQQLNEDMERHLGGFPILAKKEHGLRIAWKFAVRHKLAVGSFALATTMILTLTIALFFQYQQAERGRILAEREREKVSRTTDFMVNLFELPDPYQAGEKITALELLDNAAKGLDDSLEDEPAVRAYMMEAVGRVYTNLGQYEKSQSILKTALDIQETRKETADQSSTAFHLGRVMLYKGEYEQARANLELALSLQSEIVGDQGKDMIPILQTLAELHYWLSNYDLSASYVKKTLDIYLLNPEENAAGLAESYQNMAMIRIEEGKLNEAEPMIRKSIEIREKVYGTESPLYTLSLSGLASIHSRREEYDQSVVLYKKVLDVEEKTLGKNHPDLAATLSNLSECYRFLGQFDRAEAGYKRGLEISREAHGSEHPEVAIILNNLGALFVNWGKFEQAETYYQQALDIFQLKPDIGRPDIAICFKNLGRVNRELTRYEDSIKYYQQAIALEKVVLDENHPSLAESYLGLADCYGETGELEQALALCKQALQIEEKAFGVNHPSLIETLKLYAAILDKADATEQANKIRARLVELNVNKS